MGKLTDWLAWAVILLVIAGACVSFEAGRGGGYEEYRTPDNVQPRQYENGG